MLTVDTKLPSILQPSWDSYSFRALRYCSKKISDLDYKVVAYVARVLATIPVTLSATADLMRWCGRTVLILGYGVLDRELPPKKPVLEHLTDLISTVTIPITTFLMATFGGVLPPSNRIGLIYAEWELTKPFDNNFYAILGIARRNNHMHIMQELYSRSGKFLNDKTAMGSLYGGTKNLSRLQWMLMNTYDLVEIQAFLEAGADIDQPFLEHFSKMLDEIAASNDLDKLRESWGRLKEADKSETFRSWLTGLPIYWNPGSSARSVASARQAIEAVYAFQKTKAAAAAQPV